MTGTGAFARGRREGPPTTLVLHAITRALTRARRGRRRSPGRAHGSRGWSAARTDRLAVVADVDDVLVGQLVDDRPRDGESA